MKSKYPPFIPESLLRTSVTISCMGTVDISIQFFFLVVSLYFASVHCDKNVPLRSLYSGLGYEYIFFFMIYLTTFAVYCFRP
jgi:hypothetical protein